MDEKQEIRALREQGLTIRDIAERTNIPKSTVHKILQSNPGEDVVFANIVPDEDGIDWTKAIYIHLPYTYFCPECGKEQRHAWLCPLCGKFLPAECDQEGCCYEGFDLSEVKRKAEIIE